ncbi:hypothetical protein BKA70DRAFT_110792 [Coprinopsis sp. MPI-PUGE-AT-0042]|nr:hypothetical protein BKA70DRAFT_110792 [Coprinopsis sp. MPI-PUGE-AT-0042]
MDGGGSSLSASPRGGDGAVGGPSLFQGACSVQINGGTFIQTNCGVEKAIESTLEAIPNYRDIHNANLAKATEGTGPCFPEWKEYCSWLISQDSLKTMWGTGMPGAGKTVFASIVINEVELHAQANHRICIAYIYFRYSDHTTASVRDFLAVLVKQTIERHPDCLPICLGLYGRHIREKTQPSEAELLHLLHRFSEMMAVTFYFLEALDEAPKNIQLELLEKLNSLNVKLFVTSRPVFTVEARFPGTHRFPIRAQDRDLDLYITTEISRSLVLQRVLNQAGPTLREMVTETIKRKCEGMFLHASLQIDALRACTSVYDIRQSLEEFPSRIEIVYHETWKRILGQTPKMVVLAKNVLVWVLCATRSLTIEELRHAIATCPDTHRFDGSRLVDEATLMGLCRGLVIVEESGIVRFVHYTAKNVVKGLIFESIPYPHSLPTAVCMALLAEHGFQEATLDKCASLQTTLKVVPLLGYAYESWSIHARESVDDESVAVRLAHFVQGCRAFPVELTRPMQACDDILEPIHVVAYFDLPVSFAGPANLHRANNRTCIKGGTPLILAIRRNSLGAVKELLLLPQILVNATDVDGYTPLMWALEPINQVIVTLLLAHRKINVNALDDNGHSSLMRSSDFDSEEAATLLLAHANVHPNQVDPAGHTALMLASYWGCRRVVQGLLADPRVKIHLRSKAGETARDIAQAQGHDEIYELLRAHSTHENHQRSLSLVDLLPHIMLFEHDATGSLLLVGSILAMMVSAIAVEFWLRGFKLELEEVATLARFLNRN